MSDDANDSVGQPATLPAPETRMPVQMLPPPHPVLLAIDRLVDQCGLRTQRRSGPGGQHRNKTSSGVFLHHQPTGITAEATERRSQADNRSVAVTRLRFRLAVEIRTPSIFDSPARADEAALRTEFAGSDLRINQRNAAKPAVLALLLNDCHAAGGQPTLVAKQWQTTSTAVVRLLKSHRPAFELVNQIRKHHNRSLLK
jgi:hypothetical protein